MENLRERLQFTFVKRLPMQRQIEAGECGLACLSMIASYYGYKTDIASLRKHYSVSQKGVKLSQLIDMATSLKLSARPVRLDLEELGNLQTPCILHWNLDHFVVLKKVDRKGAIIHDPARGVRRYNAFELSAHFTGVALELSPAPGFVRKVEREAIHLRQMMGKVVGLKRSLIQVGLMALALEVFALVAPFFNQWVVDQAVVAGDLDLLVTLAVGFGLLKIIGVAIDAIRTWAVTVMSTTLNVQWLANLYTHLLKLPVSYFQKRQMGDVVSRFNSIHTIQSTLTTSFIGAILDGIMSLGTLIMMIIYDPMLTAIGVGAIFLYMGLRSAFYASLLSATESAIVHDAKQQTMFMETVRGIQSIRLYAKERERKVLWLNSVIDQKNASLRTQRLNLVFQTGSNFLFGLEEIIVLSYGAKMVIEHHFSVGMLLAFMSYKGQFSSRVASFIDRMFELKMLKLQGIRLADIALAEPEPDSSNIAFDTESIHSGIEVTDLSFSYGIGEKSVLRDVNFKIEAGESVAIVGPSGCGKTTLIKLLLGIYPPKNGEIKIGGVPIDKIGLSNYRSMVGTVMQDDSLFAGTVADNISFFGSDPDQKWIESCAKMAAVHDEIQAMPMGYNTLVGDMGTGLSGGQKQRVLLARALHCKPKILFLDEATSHLDVANERLVSYVIKKLNLTRIIVAHRPETIAGADRVITLVRPTLAQPPASAESKSLIPTF